MKHSMLLGTMLVGSMTSASILASSLPCISDIQGNGTQNSPYVIKNNTRFCDLKFPESSTTYFIYQNSALAMGVFKLSYDDNGGRGTIDGHLEKQVRLSSLFPQTLSAKYKGTASNYEYYSISTMASGKWLMTISTDKSGPLEHADFSAFIFYGKSPNPYQFSAE
ncbi:hypothetical protein D5018_05890 [Parashewanella curva]|uniref:YtkA-like domain-containing protein n=1 Tax=Parashewanella curva TaxID=2338552 RepID=A0A3L8PZ43_9GAMM|nr:hypothetical protein [Parashewanella curva]RLV60631.1 hypothetical protein D5018_05890 [Parashewanella curva]